MQHYDIVIVGAGMAGLNLALSLQDQPLKIAILEHHLPALLESHQDLRPISLSYASEQFYQTLGLWPALAFSARAIETVHISEKNQFGATRIHAEELGLPALGYVLPYGELQKNLYERVQQLDQVEWIFIDSLDAMVAPLLEVTTNCEQKKISADLIIGADGAHSRVRELAGISATFSDQPLLALTGELQLKSSMVPIAYERFTKLGTIAILPQPGKKCGVVWTMTDDNFRRCAEKSSNEWVQLLQSMMGYRLGKMLNFQKTGSYRLAEVVVEKQQISGVILIGNAAHTLLPLAAQGLNLSLRDIALLAECIVSDTLDEYAEKRQADQKNIARLTQLASVDRKSLGLFLSDVLPVLNQWIGKMGVGHGGGYLPKLMRGIALEKVL